jgi:ribosomal 30S subunit maturation factor RimM
VSQEQKKREEERRVKREIENELVDALPEDEDEYFDVDLTELEALFKEYTALLGNK